MNILDYINGAIPIEEVASTLASRDPVTMKDGVLIYSCWLSDECAEEVGNSNENENHIGMFVVNPSKKSFFCHKCKRGGDVIALISMTYEISPLDAICKIIKHDEWNNFLFKE